MVSIILLCAGCGRDEPARYGLSLLEPSAAWQDRKLVIETALDMNLSRAARDALEHGVPLIITMETRISRVHGFFARAAETTTRSLELRYLPLSRHYQLTLLDSGQRRSYPRLWMLLDALEEPLELVTGADRAKFGQGTWQAQVRAYLDIGRLPSPMRLPAWFSSQWRLSSEWTTWRIDAA